MTVDVSVLLQLSNLLLIPALGYIIALERRLMKLETRIELMLNQMENRHG